jgi:hypothetical protein
MPYQLDDNDIKLILLLFDTHVPQSMTLTSQQQLLRLRLCQALSLDISALDISANQTISDDINHQTDSSSVSNEYYILPSE